MAAITVITDGGVTRSLRRIAKQTGVTQERVLEAAAVFVLEKHSVAFVTFVTARIAPRLVVELEETTGKLAAETPKSLNAFVVAYVRADDPELWCTCLVEAFDEADARARFLREPSNALFYRILDVRLAHGDADGG